MVPCASMILYKMGYRKRNRTPGWPSRLLVAAVLLGSALALWGCAPDEEVKRERQCVTLAGGLHGELIHREAIALVLTGEAGKDKKYDVTPDLVCRDLLEAVEKILEMD